MKYNKKTIINRVNKIMEIVKRMDSSTTYNYMVQNFISDMEFCTQGYSEPGYSSESGMVMISNWNDITYYDRKTNKSTLISNLPSRLNSVFERMGIDCVYYDEWTTCGDCGKCVRTQGDSYSWMQSYHDFDNERLCIECILKNPECYLEDLEGKANVANTMIEDPSKYGYVKINQKDYMNDWYGNDDNPIKLSRELDNKGISRYLFSVNHVGQFDINFSMYVHSEEEHLLHTDDDCDDCDDTNAPTQSITTYCVNNTIDNVNDCECKFCKCKLNKGESPCWNCGLENPTL